MNYRRYHLAVAVAATSSAVLLAGIVYCRGSAIAENLHPILLGMAVFGIAPAVLKNRRGMLNLAIVCLPLTQVPTLKLLVRLRISEVIAWASLPRYIRTTIMRGVGRPARCFVISMALYFFYTGVVGVALSPVAEIHLSNVLDYFINPFFRSLLETARGIAALGIIVDSLRQAGRPADFSRYCALLAWGGAISGSYALYQASSLAFGLELPLLPETLSPDSGFRPFGTFYEPTGTGSFTAASTLLSLYFVVSAGRKLPWLVCLLLNASGFFVSLARAGWLGLAAGCAVLLAGSMLRHRHLPLMTATLCMGAGALLVGWWTAEAIFGSRVIGFALSAEWFSQTAPSRIEAYYRMSRELPEIWGLGFGQGLYIFRGGGAPGFVRLIMEGGVAGVILLLLMHGTAVYCIRRLRENRSDGMGRLSMFLAAAYASCVVTTLNYINTTDIWIWFVWSLPVICHNSCTMGGKS